MASNHKKVPYTFGTRELQNSLKTPFRMNECGLNFTYNWAYGRLN